MGYNYIILPQLENELLKNYQTQVYLIPSLKRFLKTLLSKSYTIQYINHLNDRKRLTRIPERKVHIPFLNTEYLDQVVQSYTQNIIRMNQFCTVLGINFFAVLQPEVSQKENKSEQEKSIIELMDEYLWDYKQDYTSVYHRFRKIRTNSAGTAGTVCQYQ